MNDKSHSNELAKLRMRKLRSKRKEQKLKDVRLALTAEQAEIVKRFAFLLQARDRNLKRMKDAETLLEAKRKEHDEFCILKIMQKFPGATYASARQEFLQNGTRCVID